MSRNVIFGGLAVVIMATFLALFNGQDRPLADEPKTPAALKTITIAAFPGSPNAHYPLYVAEQEGFFAEEGLKVEIVELMPGLSSAALLAGEIDYTQYIREVATAALAGVPVKVAAMYPEEPVFTVMTAKEIGAADIRSIGPKVPYSTQHYYALKVADAMGDPVTIVTSNALTLLASGEIDAAVVNLADPFILADDDYQVTEVISSDLLFGLSALSETIANNPAEVAGIIRARERAFTFMREHPDQAKTYMHEVLEIDTTERGQESVRQIYDLLMTRSDQTRPNIAAMDELIQLAKAADFKTLDDITGQTVIAADREKVFDYRSLELTNDHE